MTAEQRSSLEPEDAAVVEADKVLSSSGTSDGAGSCASPALAVGGAQGTGAVAAAGLLSSTTLTNQQAGSATAPAGTGSLSQVNDAIAAVSGTGTAEAQSGDAPAGTPSGDATATGAWTMSALTTTTGAAVTVGGANDGTVSVRSTTVMGVDETATASATSGQGATWGGAPGGSGCLTGLVVGGTIVGEQSAVIVPDGGTAPVTIVHQASADISAAGAGVTAASPGEAGERPPGTGGAAAVGLATQDRVAMHADVAVRVAGDNHGLIELVIEAAAHIRNVAGAAAASGAAALGIHADGLPTGPAAVVGAAVRNVVRFASSLTVTVLGDNHAPIDILVDLASSIFNWGRADASSAEGGRALGLDARSLVDLTSFVRIDIQGSNYAPIRIRVRLGADIWNEGYAYAIGGDSLISGPTPASALGPDSAMRSGDASCVGASGLVSLTNSQLAVARGTHRTASNFADLAAKLDGTATCGTGDVRVSATASEISAESGNALALGSDLAVTLASMQEAVARAGDRPDPTPDASSSEPASAPMAPVPTPVPSPRSTPASAPVVAAAPAHAASSASTRRKDRAVRRTVFTDPGRTVRIRTLPATATTPGGPGAVLIALPAVAGALWVVGRRERRRSSKKETLR